MATIKEKEFEKVLKALANRRRLAVVGYLKRHQNVAITDIAAHIDLSVKATSKHVSLLAAVGIVEKEQVSKLMLASLAHNLPRISRPIIALL